MAEAADIQQGRLSEDLIHQEQALKQKSNTLIIESQGAWIVDNGRLSHFTPARGLSSYARIHAPRLDEAVTSIAGYGNRLYSVTSMYRNGQWVLLLKAFLNDSGEIKKLWRRVIKPSSSAIGQVTLKCEPEIAVSGHGIYLLCNRETIAVRHDNQKTTLSETIKPGIDRTPRLLDNHGNPCNAATPPGPIINTDGHFYPITEPLKGLVVDRNGRLYAHDHSEVYAISKHQKGKDVNIDTDLTGRLPAKGLVLTDNHQLLVPYLKMPATLHIDIYDISHSKPIRQSSRTIVLSDFYDEKTGPHFNWDTGTPTLSKTGYFYIPLTRTRHQPCPFYDFGKDCYETETVIVMTKLLNSGIDPLAWSKRYHDNKNSNRMPSSLATLFDLPSSSQTQQLNYAQLLLMALLAFTAANTNSIF